MKRIAKEDLEHILKYTELLWEKIRGKSIFITGGTGFFGKWLLESFIYCNKRLQLNSTITVLSRDPEKFLKEFPFYGDHLEVSFLKGDVLDFEFPVGKYHFVIHAATEADAKLNTENPLLMLDTITKGTRRVLDFAVGQKVESFLLTSSGAVYGKQPSNVNHIKETDSFFIDINDSNSAYAEGKRLSELYSAIYSKQFGLQVKIARCFAFVGPYLPLDKHYAIGNFIMNGLNNENIVIKGVGTTCRSYLYVSDLIIWLWTILIFGKSNQPYNVGSDIEISIVALAQKIISLHNTKLKIISEKNKAFSNDNQERYIPSIQLVNNELNLKMYIDVDKAINNTLKFYSNEPY
jgi:dTDP-glucose 4,6-dehydratase